MPTAHEVFNARLTKAMNDRNYDEYEALLTDDYMGEYPQSARSSAAPRTRGRASSGTPAAWPKTTSTRAAPGSPPPTHAG